MFESSRGISSRGSETEVDRRRELEKTEDRGEETIFAELDAYPPERATALIEPAERGGLGDVFAQVLATTRMRERGWLDFDEIERMLEQHRRGDADYGMKLWILMNLFLWFDRFIDASR